MAVMLTVTRTEGRQNLLGYKWYLCLAESLHYGIDKLIPRQTGGVGVDGRMDDVKQVVRQETIERFAEKVSRRRNRGIEPRNGGPTAYDFAKMIGSIGTDYPVHGTVLRRFAKAKG
jgi:hypothetical protein